MVAQRVGQAAMTIKMMSSEGISPPLLCHLLCSDNSNFPSICMSFAWIIVYGGTLCCSCTFCQIFYRQGAGFVLCETTVAADHQNYNVYISPHYVMFANVFGYISFHNTSIMPFLLQWLMSQPSFLCTLMRVASTSFFNKAGSPHAACYGHSPPLLHLLYLVLLGV